MNAKVKIFGLCGVLALCLVACGEDDNDDSDDRQRPAGAEAVVSAEQLLEFEEAGAVVHYGLTPPSIAGTYYFGDYDVEYTDSDTWPAFSSWCHDITTYAEGDEPDLYIATSESPNCDAASEGQANYISGDDGCFTLYGETDWNFEGCEGSSVGITSACLEENGDFSDPRFANLTTAIDGEPCEQHVNDGRIPGLGDITITSQSDGVAERIEN